MSAQRRHQTGCHSKAARHPRIAFDQTVERRETAELWHPHAATNRASQTTERLSGQGRLVSQGRLAHKEQP
jgi:hypothetical protein